MCICGVCHVMCKGVYVHVLFAMFSVMCKEVCVNIVYAVCFVTQFEVTETCSTRPSGSPNAVATLPYCVQG